MEQPFSFRIYQDTRYKPNEKGEYPIKLIVTQKFILDSKGKPKRTHNQLDNCHCSEDVFQALFPEWSNRNSNKLLKSYIKKVKSSNQELLNNVNTLLDKCNKINLLGQVHTNKELFQELGRGTGTVNVKPYFDDLIRILEERNSFSTRDRYDSAFKSFNNFHTKKLKNKAPLNFLEINKTWIVNYVQWMEDEGKSATTSNNYLKNLRKIFNNAIKDVKCPIEKKNSPFGANDDNTYLIKNPRRKINKVLTYENFEKLKSYKGKTFNQREALDLFLFSYYSGGVNLVDIAHLKKKDLFLDVDEPFFNVIRQKNRNRQNEQILSVNISDFLMSIIEKYEGSGQYVFKYLDGAKTIKEKHIKYGTLRKKIGKNLRKIAEDLDIKGGLTFGMARHYLFNYMHHSKEFTSSEIQAVTNHSDIRTTENYLSSLRQDKMREIWRKVRGGDNG